MNSYTFEFLRKPTTAPVVPGDLALLTKLCRQIGYLWGAPGGPRNVDFSIKGNVVTGAFVAANTVAGEGIGTLKIDSPYRLPASLEPTFPSDVATGDLMTAGGAILSVNTVSDDACGTVISNLDKSVVTEGCLIVAYLPVNVDVSEQLSTQLNIPTCDGQRLVIGIANQTATDGVYVPLTTAMAYAVIGGKSIKTVTVTDRVKTAATARR